MHRISKTNAARILDRKNIKYELIPYSCDEEHLSADHVASQLGEDLRQVFKTLVLRGDRTGIFVCVIPGGCELDLKAAAKDIHKRGSQGASNQDIPVRSDRRGGGCRG